MIEEKGYYLLDEVNSFTRWIMNESMEMYLETIYILEKEHGHAHNLDIANRLGVSKPSVSKAMENLFAKGYINKEKYGTISLTADGLAYSRDIYGKHEMISEYLVKALGLSQEEAANNACKIEHIISDALFQAIKEYLEK